MGTTQPERRRRRTEELLGAVTYQLEACREDADLQALVLSDLDGTCLAFAGSSEISEELAALLPVLDRASALDPDVPEERNMLVRKLRLDGAELYLAAIGGAEDELATSIERSACGVSRILGSA